MNRSVVFLVSLLVVFFMMYGCAGKKDELGFFVPSPDEEWNGTWVNADPASGIPHQKIINYDWGYYEVFNLVENSTPDYIGCSTLVKKWTDSEGNIWYREFDRTPQNPGGMLVLNKISKAGTVLEYVVRQDAFPTEKDLASKSRTLYYGILYRQ